MSTTNVDTSIILITVREDFTIMGKDMANTHILAPCIKSLEKQTHKNFELIVVDGLYQFRPHMFEGEPFKCDFPVKHVPLHSTHQFWWLRKRPFSCASFNTGIIYSEGELIVKLDDCCQFESNYLAKIWDLYDCGYYPLALHIRYINGKPAYVDDEELMMEISRTNDKETFEAKVNKNKELYGEHGVIKDSRWKEVEENGGQMIAKKNWFYGYSAVPLDTLLKVNGMDELMDGDFTLMDVDLGQRIGMAEHENIFLLDKDLWVIEHAHLQLSARAFTPYMDAIKCNYAILKLNEKNRRWKANVDKLSAEDIKFVKEETLRSPCSWKPHVYADDCEGESFKLWENNQPSFNLKEERKQYQSK